VAFAKKPRDFSQKINKTMKKAAFYSAVSEKIRDGKVIIIDELTLTEAKTKLVANAAKALKLTGKSLFVTEEYDATAVLAARNIPSVTLEEARLLNTYSVVANSNLVLTVGAVRKLEEAAK
jgi:large subunit ribosomal protein L4